MKLRKRYLFLIGNDIDNSLDNISYNNNNIKLVLPSNDSIFDYTRKEKILEKFEDICLEISYDENELINVIKNFNPDFLICYGWRRIITKTVLELIPLAINIHPALLPEYKGYHTEPYIIQNDEKKHGITAHILTEGLDEGDIILRKEFDINKFSTVKSLKHGINTILPGFLKELLINLDQGTYSLQIQDKSKNKVIAPKRTVIDSFIDCKKSLEELYNYIRSCDKDNYPAFFYLNGQKINIALWRDIDDNEKENMYDL